MNKWDLFNKINVNICDVLKTVSEWEFYVEDQKLKIKILIDVNDKYCYLLSHYLKTPEQADEYRPSIHLFETEEEALSDALSSLFMFYDKNGNHDNYKWVKNANY